ncbi:hypothetical protein PIROE2DRAFT_14719 [Piromyces sp. E2]|nr:hypothetical protein PIROE2DRAFT_14719 [Piromyces sp. E2]|eukprot:OUM59667.1 hypothetical protein PIROE2DRAFT_14719 [Piromyces sp. E2]
MGNVLDSKEVLNSDDGDTTMATITVSDISSQVGTVEKDDDFLNDNVAQSSTGHLNPKSINNIDNDNNNSNSNNNNNNNNNGDNHSNNNRAFSSIQPSDDEFVQCPLCLQSIQVKRLNRHIDLGCPKENPPGESSNNPLSFFKSSSKSDNDSAWKDKIFSNPIVKPKTKNKIKKLRSLAYNLLTESKLRKILKDLKIPSHGDKTLMQKRHAEYVNLFNANCDLEHPKSHQRLVEELKRWEKINFETSSPFSKHNPYPKLFFSSKHGGSHNNGNNNNHGSLNLSGTSQNDTDLEEIDKERQQYLQSHKTDFYYLINQIKKRGNKKDKSDNTDTIDKSQPDEFIDYTIFNDDHFHYSSDDKSNKNKNIKNKTVRKKQNESDDEYCEESRPSKKARIRRKANVKTPTKRYNTRSSHISLSEEDDRHSDVSSIINPEGSSCSSNSNRNNATEVYEILSSDDESTMVIEENKEIVNSVKDHVEEKNEIDNKNHDYKDNIDLNEIQNNTKDDISTPKKIKIESNLQNKNKDDISTPKKIKIESNQSYPNVIEEISGSMVEVNEKMDTSSGVNSSDLVDKTEGINSLLEGINKELVDNRITINSVTENNNKKEEHSIENKEKSEENKEDYLLNSLEVDTHLQDISNEMNINNPGNESISNGIKSLSKSSEPENSNEVVNLISP